MKGYEDLALIISTALVPEVEMEKKELERDIDSSYQMKYMNFFWKK